MLIAGVHRVPVSTPWSGHVDPDNEPLSRKNVARTLTMIPEVSMRHPRLAGLSLLLAVFAVPTLGAQSAEKQQPPKPKAEAEKSDSAKAAQAKPDSASAQAKVEVKTEAKAAGDVAPATAAQVIASVGEAAATTTALQSAELTDVRLVSTADVFDATSAAILDAALLKSAADVAKLRQAAEANARVKAALAAGNVPADRIVGVSIAAGVATVYHKAQ
jgi:hypothetical protein